MLRDNKNVTPTILRQTIIMDRLVKEFTDE